MLGHADSGIALDLYSHVTPTMHAHAECLRRPHGDPLHEPPENPLAVKGVVGNT